MKGTKYEVLGRRQTGVLAVEYEIGSQVFGRNWDCELNNKQEVGSKKVPTSSA
jgi:hypothetical protein